MTKQETLDQLHATYSKFCAWTRDEETEYMPVSLVEEITQALLSAARAIDRLPDEPTAANCARHGQIVETGCPDCERALNRTGES